MSQTQNWIIAFACLLCLTAFSSYIGDDDVIYQYLDRKPTPREGIIRIRWVILKGLVSVYGGFVLGTAVRKLLADCCSTTLSGDPAVLIGLACIALVSLLIGILQNEIRHLCGRPRRPLIDHVVWQRSVRGPLGRRR
jgi:hypothetical protein